MFQFSVESHLFIALWWFRDTLGNEMCENNVFLHFMFLLFLLRRCLATALQSIRYLRVEEVCFNVPPFPLQKVVECKILISKIVFRRLESFTSNFDRILFSSAPLKKLKKTHQ